MRRRPWMLIVLALFHFLAPFGNLILNAVALGLPVRFYINNAFDAQNMIHNWVDFVIPVIAGIAIYLCKRWSFILYLACMVILFISSYHGYQEHHGQKVLLELIFVFIFNITIVAYFLIPAVRQVYFNPRLRWWETEDRFSANIKTDYIFKGETHAGTISNISNSGLFLKSQDAPRDHSMLVLKFTFDKIGYEFKGNVIHHGQQNRMGFGVQFLHDTASNKSIRQLTKSLRMAGHLLDDRKPTKDDSFLTWLKNLLLTGKGIIPSDKNKH